jgi:hypothetical protein
MNKQTDRYINTKTDIQAYKKRQTDRQTDRLVCSVLITNDDFR